jgi:hypothetical protein
VVPDLAVSLALGGDCLADIAVLRAEPAVFGLVASDPTVSRTIDVLAADSVSSLQAINTARATARARVWSLAGENAPDHATTAAQPLIVDVDATLVGAHSEKGAGPADIQTRVRPSPVVGVRRPRCRGHRGTVGGDTASGQRRIEHRRRSHPRAPGGASAAPRPQTWQPARAQSAGPYRWCRRDACAAEWMVGQRLSYSVGFSLPANTADLLTLIPEQVWAPAYDSDGGLRDGAWVAELTGL